MEAKTCGKTRAHQKPLHQIKMIILIMYSLVCFWMDSGSFALITIFYRNH